MPIDNPTALVEEFKKSGEFDRLRRELLAQFQQDESYSALKTRVEEIGRQRLAADPTLQYVHQEQVHKELTQEVERYPIVERAVADVRIFSDSTFLANMHTAMRRILQEDKQKGAPVTTVQTSVEPIAVPAQLAEQGAQNDGDSVEHSTAGIPAPQTVPANSNMEITHTQTTPAEETQSKVPSSNASETLAGAVAVSKTDGDQASMDVD